MTTMFQDMMTGLNEVDAFLAGEKTGYRVSVPTEVDVKLIRKRLNMTQSRFSDTFGFSLDAVKHWEGGRRTPEFSARAFLTVIARNPNAVIEALQPASKSRAAFRSPGSKPTTGRKMRLAAATKGKATRRAAS